MRGSSSGSGSARRTPAPIGHSTLNDTHGTKDRDMCPELGHPLRFPSTLNQLFDEIDALIADVIVDAYTESEQLWSFSSSIRRHWSVPVPSDRRRRRGGGHRSRLRRRRTPWARRHVSTSGRELHGLALDITPASPLPLQTSQLIAACRRWAGATPPHTPDSVQTTRWAYPRFGSADSDVGAPLGLPLTSIRPARSTTSSVSRWCNPERAGTRSENATMECSTYQIPRVEMISTAPADSAVEFQGRRPTRWNPMSVRATTTSGSPRRTRRRRAG